MANSKNKRFHLRKHIEKLGLYFLLLTIIVFVVLNTIFIQTKSHSESSISHLLSNESNNKLLALNNKYNLTDSSYLFEPEKHDVYQIHSILKTDMFNIPKTASKLPAGILIKLKDDQKDDFVVLNPNKKINNEKLSALANIYEQEIPEIEYAEPDLILNVYSTKPPIYLHSLIYQNSIKKINKYLLLLDRFNKLALNQIEEIKRNSIETTSEDTIVLNSQNLTNGLPPIAIIDSGVDISHPQFFGKIYKNDREINNQIDDDNNSYIDDSIGWNFTPMEDDNVSDNIGHGTHIAGIITENSENPIMPLKVFDIKSESRLSYALRAIRYASDNGAKVLNLSFGTTVDSQALKDSIDYANNQGVVIVSAAGNDSNDIPHYPAAYNNVVSVGALNKDGDILESSNYGDWVDIYANGDQIISTIPNKGYGVLSGTSQATPFISAKIAKILNQNVELQNKDGSIKFELLLEKLHEYDFSIMKGPRP